MKQLVLQIPCGWMLVHSRVTPSILLGQGRTEVCGIKDQRGGIRDQKGGIWDHRPGSRITSQGIGICRNFRDQGSGCTILVESGTKLCHAFRIKDQKFGYKNGINDEKHTLLQPC